MAAKCLPIPIPENHPHPKTHGNQKIRKGNIKKAVRYAAGSMYLDDIMFVWT
jgi:hypothetical protein